MTNLKAIYILRVTFLLILIGSIWGCSQYSTKPAAVGFHNFSAKYNAYFLGDKDLASAEFGMDSVFKDDYNQLLPLLLPMDSMLALPFKPFLASAIKKASVVAEKHQNSKWTDNAYYILGKSRLYLGQWPDGLEALRYVYANGTDEADKNRALILLMRAYVYKKDFSNALGVAEYISQQPLSKSLQRDFFLTKAYLHQQNGEYLTSVAILEETFPLLSRSKEKARAYFAAGQMYDRLGEYGMAIERYKKVAKTHPNYDLGFYSSMSALQNQVVLNPNTDLSAVGFNKMLKDRKNLDLQDRIYYTMGLLEEHKKNIPKAIEYLQKSVSVSSTKAGSPKAYTYLQLARIHYDRLEKFDLAKAYYDSALAVLPKDAPEFLIVSDRKRALDTFATQYEIVAREDSLQKLARLSTVDLDSRIDQIIDQLEKKRLEQEKVDKAKAQAAAKANNGANPGNAPQFGNERRWELYDPSLINIGKIEFKRNWGNRDLEDNWRRSSKQASAIASVQTDSMQVANPILAKSDQLEKGSTAWNDFHATLKADIPLSDSAMRASLGNKEKALYHLGKIYRFDLKEDDRAVATFNRLLGEYPQTGYKDELYYLLFLTIEQEPEKGSWKKKLMDEFPQSTYARLINKSLESNEADRANPIKAYESAYNQYAAGNHEKALDEIEKDMPAYQGTMLEDKFALLRIFLIGKVRGREAYLQAINEFIRLYPSSIYLPRVKEMQELSTLSMGRK